MSTYLLGSGNGNAVPNGLIINDESNVNDGNYAIWWSAWTRFGDEGEINRLEYIERKAVYLKNKNKVIRNGSIGP